MWQKVETLQGLKYLSMLSMLCSTWRYVQFLSPYFFSAAHFLPFSRTSLLPSLRTTCSTILQLILKVGSARKTHLLSNTSNLGYVCSWCRVRGCNPTVSLELWRTAMDPQMRYFFFQHCIHTLECAMTMLVCTSLFLNLWDFIPESVSQYGPHWPYLLVQRNAIV